MVKQYPYRLKVLEQIDAFFDQSTAEWIEGNSQWVDYGICRDEINGSGSKITTTDGENYVFSAVVYAPKNIKPINKGTKIQVWNEDELRLEGIIVRFSKDQLHSRIWL